MTTNPLAVAALFAVAKTRPAGADFNVLSGIFNQVFGDDLDVPYPGNILSIPSQAAKAVSFNYCDESTYKKFDRASSASDFFEAQVDGKTYKVKVCIYSVRDESAVRLAMHIEGINTSLFVRMIPSQERLERFKHHPKIRVDSEETIVDGSGAKVPFCTYHSEDSDVKRFAVVPPKSCTIQFNPEWVPAAVESTTSHF